MSRPRRGDWPDDPEPLPRPIIDNHTHLESVLTGTDSWGWRGSKPAGDESVAAELDVDAHLARAARAGVTRALQIGCDLDAAAWTDAIVRARPELLGGVAIHPNEAVLHAGVRELAPDGLEPAPHDRHSVDLDTAIARIEAIARGNDRIRAIGETGLDHFRAGEQGRLVQRAAFRAHIALAKELGLALQIHDRDAHDEVLEVLLADGAPERTVFHCFSGDEAMARVCAEHGWYLSFAGTLTFSTAGHLREALKAVGPARVMVETDAPYLTAHPFRGRPNAPYLAAHTMRALAEVLGLDLGDACRKVEQTTIAVYGEF